MKIKIIDILNKIANGEEVPKKIVWKDKIYIYDEDEKDYYDTDECEAIFDYHEITDILNDEVEILETTITYKPDNIKKLEEKTSEIRFAIEHLGIETVLATYSSKINEIIEVIYEK